LIDAQGNAIESTETLATLVENQRVALYFGASWCGDCRNLEFMLAQYRSALADSNQPIQLIYVPSDNSQDDQLSRMQELGLEVGVPLGESADALKRQYGVWPDVDIQKFGGVSRELAIEEEEAVPAVEGSEGEKVAVERVSVTEEIEDVRDEFGRRSGIPAFVVLDNKGEEFCFLNAERDSISVLADWPLDDPANIW
jgi:thiol-disulfide isomerase/thioredoxin